MKTMLIVIAVAVLVFGVLIWTRGGFYKGRKFGNEIADHLGWSRNFFHSVLDNGVGTLGPSLQLLAAQDDESNGSRRKCAYRPASSGWAQQSGSTIRPATDDF